MPLSKHISGQDVALLLQQIWEQAIPYRYEHDKHRLVLLDEIQEEILFFRLPITLPPPLPNLQLLDSQVNYIILLVQSGNCAVGYFEDGKNLNHKVFRSYMVRKKQGKSQIKYLKTKGKSRAGSRVRLGETIEFFENINERLQTYFEEHKVDRIAISCSKTLIPFLYNAKVPTPFQKNDPRIYKIPKHIHTPIYEVMLDANKFLQKGELIYEDKYSNLADKLLLNISPTDEQEDDHDDW